MRHLFLGLIPVIAIACTVSANVGDLTLTSPMDGGTDAAAATDGTVTTDTGSPSTDSAPPPIIDAGCGVALPQEGSFLDVQVIMGPQPFPNGGTLVPGVYKLTAMRVYDPGVTGTMQVAETLRIRGSSSAGTFERLTEARSASGTFQAYPLHGETLTFQTSGSTGTGDPSIFVTPECPAAGVQQIQRFGVAGDAVTLLDDQTSTERVFQRVP